MTNTNEQADDAGAAPNNSPCPFCSSTSNQAHCGKETRCNDCGNTFTEGQVVHASLSGVAAAAPGGVFRCPVCCAPAGQPCAPGCTEGTLASAVRKALDMLAALDASKVPLAVAGALSVLRCGLDAGERPSAQVAAPAPDTMYAALVLLATSTAAAPMITTMQKLPLGRAQAVIKASALADKPRADSAGGPDEGELRAEFVRQHAGRDLSQHRLRGTYTSANIAALWNQHKRTAEWMAARAAVGDA